MHQICGSCYYFPNLAIIDKFLTVCYVSGLRGFLIKSDQQERKDGLARGICDLCQPSLSRGGQAGSPGRQMLPYFATTLPPLPPLFASTRPRPPPWQPGLPWRLAGLVPASPPSPRCSPQQKAANQQRDHEAPANQRPAHCCCELCCYSALIFPVTVPQN